jgi:hypothetical protein
MPEMFHGSFFKMSAKISSKSTLLPFPEFFPYSTQNFAAKRSEPI